MNRLFVFLLFCASLFGAGQAMARHLVIDLETVLVQRIPYKDFKSFKNKKQMFQVKEGDSYLSFYVQDLAREWVKLLLEREDIILSLTSDRSTEVTQEILDQLDKNLRSSLLAKKGRILTLEDKNGKFFDLSLIAASDLIYLTHNTERVSKAQSSQVLDLGQSYYKFEAWVDSQSRMASDSQGQKKFYAQSEEAWKRDALKISLLANLFKKKTYPQSIDALKLQLEEDIEQQIQLGSSILRGKSTEVLWVYSKDKLISGCSEFENVSEESSPRSWEKCLELLSHSRQWKYSADRSKVEACVVTNSLGVSSRPLPVSTCLDEKVKTFWKGKTEIECAYYTDDLTFIAGAPQGACDKKHILRDLKNKKNVVVVSFEGMEALSDNQILAKFPDRTMSFRKDLTDDKIQPIDKTVNEACLKAIKDVYASGMDFGLDTIRQRITTLSKVKYKSDRNDLIFYHYTRSPAMTELARSNQFMEFFKFNRSKVQYWWLYHFYVAEDPFSSSNYGPIQVKVHMKTDTRVLSEFGDLNATQLRSLVLNELADKYPSTKACFSKSLDLDDLNLYFLAAEDSGVDMVQYWNGTGNSFSETRSDNYKYFQILNPGAIDHVENGSFKEW